MATSVAKDVRMTTHFADTSPDAERVQIDLLRRAPAWRKPLMLQQLNDMARALALSGLRQRYPDATPEELRRRLAGLVLGPQLAARAYGAPQFDYQDHERGG